MLERLLWTLIVFVLRTINVSLDTVRVDLVIRRRKTFSFIVSSVSALVYVFAIAKAITSGDWLLMIGYAIGYGGGTVIGIYLMEKLSGGHSEITIISGRSDEIKKALSKKGYGVTQILGYGREKKIRMLMSIVPLENNNDFLAVVRKLDPDAIISAKSLSGAEGYYFRWSYK